MSARPQPYTIGERISIALIVAILAGICAAGWYVYADYRAAQRDAAAENVRLIEQSAKAMHKAWCNQALGDSRGDLADGSCKE